MSLISVTREDFTLGTPLPWVVYGQDASVLLEKGAVLETEEEIEILLASHPLRELSWNSPAPASSQENLEVPETEFGAEFSVSSGGSFAFEDMRLRVGDRIQLQPPAAAAHDRCFVKLIGYLDGHSILVTAPTVNGLRVELLENDEIVARIFSGQNAFGFTSHVDRVCRLPYDYVHLSFPKEIQGSVIRKSPRVRTKIIASIAAPGVTDGNDRQSGVIMNLSSEGALIKGRKPLCEKGQLIQLSFRVNLHNVDAYLTVNAIIRNIFSDEEKESKVPMYDHGVQFQNLQPNDSVILQSLIYQQMIEHPHSLV